MNEWYLSGKLESKNFICGHCGSDITTNIGYHMAEKGYTSDAGSGYIYICHKCNKPTYISFNEQVPGSLYGKSFLKGIFQDEKTYELYEEARQCMKINAYTSIGMCCRKLIMHIAVDCGAEIGKNFAHYVDYLDQNNYIPANCKKWVDIIRDKGNEANHEIVILEKKDAKQLLSFIEIIISVIYEMPYQAEKYMENTDE